MRIRARSLALATATLSIGAVWALADARMVGHDFGPARVDFQLETRPIAGPTTRPAPQPAYLSGSSITSLSDGSLVIDSDSGDLIRISDDGRRTERLAIGPLASQLVVDPLTERAYVVDRGGDAVHVVSLADGGLRRISRIATPAEPYGLALTPNRATLLVTTVADHQLTAFDTATGESRWSIELATEPRGVAVDPRGERAVVGFLTTSAVALVRLDTGPRLPALRYQAIGAASQQPSRQLHQALASGKRADRDVGRRFVRSAFATTFVGEVAVVAHQTSAPKLSIEGAERRGTYGGGDAHSQPVDHRITFVADGERTRTAQARIGVHQPRALAYDGARDMLFIAGFGSDELMALGDVSQPTVRMAWRAPISAGEPCGPTGVAVGTGDKVRVFCQLSRKVVTLNAGATSAGIAASVGPVSSSRLSAAAQRGRAVFRGGNNHQLSSFGVLACTSCHPEGRADSLSWRIGGHALQTPLLAARVAGTHPFKWDGGDPDLATSLRMTVTRLGGRGIDSKTAADLQAFLESLPAPRTPTVGDRGQVARGKALFNSRTTGCARCHKGAKLTDRKRHDLAQDLPAVDTPSLIGLAVSAPYYHDGSASTLRAVLTEKGTVHGMGRTSKLSDREIDALVAYLKTL